MVGWRPTRNAGAEEAADHYFYCISQCRICWASQEPPLGWRGGVAVVRTPVDPETAAASLRSLFASLDRRCRSRSPRYGASTSPPGARASGDAAGGVRGDPGVLRASDFRALLSFLVAQRRRRSAYVWRWARHPAS